VHDANIQNILQPNTIDLTIHSLQEI